MMTVLFCICFTGCKYSFNGTSLAPDEKTVTIVRLDNQAPIVIPTLAQNLTEALRDRFLSRTKLSVIQEGGDLHFSGTITNYSIEPLTITGGDKAAQNRLKVKVKIKYTNNKRTNLSWETEFEQFADRVVTDNISDPSIQNQMLEEIQEKIVQDIFNKALSNW